MSPTFVSKESRKSSTFSLKSPRLGFASRRRSSPDPDGSQGQRLEWLEIAFEKPSHLQAFVKAWNEFYLPQLKEHGQQPGEYAELPLHRENLGTAELPGGRGSAISEMEGAQWGDRFELPGPAAGRRWKSDGPISSQSVGYCELE